MFIARSVVAVVADSFAAFPGARHCWHVLGEWLLD